MARVHVEPVRTLLVMERTLRNSSLIEVVKSLPGVTVVGCAWGAERLQALLYSAGVELALIDLGLAGMLPGDACCAIKRRLLAPSVILVGDDASVQQRELMRGWRADAVVLRPHLHDMLPQAIARLFPGRLPSAAAASHATSRAEAVSSAIG